MTDDLSTLIAKTFISRRDAKARQAQDGKYFLDTVRDTDPPERIPWQMKDIEAHVAGTATYGHYLLGQDNNCKLFAFDIDLNDAGFLPQAPDYTDFVACNPRLDWLDRSKTIQRGWIKLQLRQLAHILVDAIHSQLDIPVAVAYTGAKGLHVYGFTGSIPAVDAVEAATIALDYTGRFHLVKGQHFYGDKESGPDSFSNFTIERFPKQTTLDGDGLGNLMRLPLGRNLKSTDPTFFVDINAPLGQLKPIDPVFALTNKNPWKAPGEL